jgi:hypothetical protein
VRLAKQVDHVEITPRNRTVTYKVEPHALELLHPPLDHRVDPPLLEVDRVRGPLPVHPLGEARVDLVPVRDQAVPVRVLVLPELLQAGVPVLVLLLGPFRRPNEA